MRSVRAIGIAVLLFIAGLPLAFFSVFAIVFSDKHSQSDSIIGLAFDFAEFAVVAGIAGLLLRSWLMPFWLTTLGTNFIRSVRGPLPQIDLLVTGVIDASNTASFLRAGAKGAAIGGNLFAKELLKAGNGAGVEQEAGKLVTAYRE